MATKLQRTVIVPDTVYAKIYKLAEKEQSNVPFVTRQLLVKALSEEKRPDWLFEIQREIIGLRNDVVAFQRAAEKKERSGEELLLELQKQIADLNQSLADEPEKQDFEPEDDKAHEILLWPELAESPSAIVQEVQEIREAEPVEVVASIEPKEKAKVIRPFFGKLSQLFGSVLG